MKSIALSTNLDTIAPSTFLRCYALESVDLPSSITLLNKSAFKDCSKLTTVNFPDDVALTALYASTLENCTSLKSLNIPKGITSIATTLCSNCKSLKEVTIPASVATIASKAFDLCDSLVSVTALGATPAKLAKANVFTTTAYANATLHVKADVVETYQGAQYWSNFKTIKPIINTGIQGVAAKADVIKVAGRTVSASGNAPVSIYTADGRLIYQGAAKTICSRLPASTS